MNEQDSYVKQCNCYCRKNNKKAALSITDKATWDNYFKYSRIYLLLNASNNPFSHDVCWNLLRSLYFSTIR